MNILERFKYETFSISFYLISVIPGRSYPTLLGYI